DAGAGGLDLLQAEAGGAVTQPLRRQQIAGARADIGVPLQADRGGIVRAGFGEKAAAAQRATRQKSARLFLVCPRKAGLGTDHPAAELPVDPGISAEARRGKAVGPWRGGVDRGEWRPTDPAAIQLRRRPDRVAQLDARSEADIRPAPAAIR